MANQYFHKPENALKRANELGSIGNKQAALQVLHDVLTAKKSRTWQAVFETIMFKYVDLCVDLQTHRHAKDGLHQYRNIAQQQQPQSLENVINYLLEAAEAACAKASSSAKAKTSSYTVADLDNLATPESIMLSTMTEEGETERAERELLVPWLKFAWETYRSVLDILKTNSKLEKVYHATSVRAFDFCRKYERRTEMRRLCEMLRKHLGDLQKATATNNTSRLRGWEGWTQEGIELQLSTRFVQLEAASALELWTEGFRTVEDIYAVARISKKAPKPKLMARYYERLTKIFWVSDNLLFHAYACWRHLSLVRESSKPVSDEERQLRACAVVLAALAIPDKSGVGDDVLDGGDAAAHAASSTLVLTSGSVAGFLGPAASYNGILGGGGAGENNSDEIDAEKNARMAALLGFASHPSRRALLAELREAGLLEGTLPCVRALHGAVESAFDPLKLASTVRPLLEEVRAIPRLAQYAVPLERMAASRLIRQLAIVYRAIELDKFHGLLGELGGLDLTDIEKLVVGAGEAGGACARLDYRARCLRFAETPSRAEARARVSGEASIAMSAKRAMYFGGDAARAKHAATEAALDELRAHLSQAQKHAADEDRRLAKSNKSTPSSMAKAAEAEAQRVAFFARCKAQSAVEHDRALQRKAVIERRKEEHERLLSEKQKAEALEKQRQEDVRKKEEKLRLEAEAREREREKMIKLQAEMELQEAREVMKALGKNVEEGDEFSEISQLEREKVIEETKAAALAKKKAEEQRLAEQAKRLDYICRSLRLEELPVLKDRHEHQLERDRADHDAAYDRLLVDEKKKHESDLAEKARLAPLAKHSAAFMHEVAEERRKRHAEAQQKARVAFYADKFARKVARARRRVEEEEEEAERRRYEEEEARERAEQEARDAEERAREAALNREREAREAKLAAEREALRVEGEIKAKADRERMRAEALEARAALDAQREAAAAAAPSQRAASPAAASSADSGMWRRGGATPTAPPAPERQPIRAAAAAPTSRFPSADEDRGTWRRGGAAPGGGAPLEPPLAAAAQPRRGRFDNPGGGDDKWKRGGGAADRPPPRADRPAPTSRPEGERAPEGKWR